MKRYLSAFVITLGVYVLLLVVVIYGWNNKTSFKINEDKTIALNHISLIQQKEVIKKPIQKETKQKPIKKLKKIKEVKKVDQKIKKVAKTVNKEIKEVETQKKSQQNQPKLQKSAIKRDYTKEYINEHLQHIVKLIQQNIRYPKRAKRFNIQGEVLIKFTLTSSGLVKDFKTIRGPRLLQKSTIKAIQSASKDFPKVQKELTLIVPVVYELT